MDLGSIFGIGSSIFGGLGSIIGGDKAADAQTDASRRSIEEQRRQYNLGLNMLEPQRMLGYQALQDIASLYGYATPGYQTANQLIGQTQQAPTGSWASLLTRIRTGNKPAAGTAPPDGLGPTTAGQSGNMTNFFASPDYNFRRTEGQRGLEQSAAARGGAFSGDALKDLTNYNSGLASGEYGNYMNRLFNMAGMGQTATGQAVNAGQNYANNYSQAQQYQGDARASGIVSGITGASNALNQGLYNYNMWNYLNPNPMNGLSELNIWQKRI